MNCCKPNLNIDLKNFVLIFFSFLILSSCQSSKVDPDLKNVGFSQCLSGHPFRELMNQELLIESSLYPNIDLQIFEANGNLDKQIDDIVEMIENNYDAIIISPLEQDSIVPYINLAKEKGIPIILLERQINSQNYDSYVGVDNIEIGRIAAKRITSSNLSNINVVEIRGDDLSSPVIERSTGFQQAIRDDSRITLLKSILPNEIESLEGIFKNYDQTPVDYIYAFNDEIAYSAWLYARTFGLESKIKFIGVDGLPTPDGGMQLVLENILDSTILYSAGGNVVFQILNQIFKGQTILKNYNLKTTLVTNENANILKNQQDRISSQQEIINNQSNSIQRQEEIFFNLKKEANIFLGLLIMVTLLSVYSFYSFLAIRRKKKQLENINNESEIQKSQLRDLSEELRNSIEARNNFFTGISHEFKTPLTLIISAIESLNVRFNEEGLKKRFNEVGLIFKNSRRLLRLINQLLDFRKIEKDNLNLKVSLTNFNEFLRAIVNDFNFEAKKRKILFLIDFPTDDVEVYIDRNLMDKVIFNLLSNAFKFTPDNGLIEIKVRIKENDLVFIIRDNGIGIPEDEIEMVFDPFTKGSNNKLTSSGLGLYLTSKILKLHHGEIKVEVKNGTIFSFKLPLGKNHFREDEIIENDLITYSLEDFDNSYDDQVEILGIGNNSIDDKFSILIIEDNRDLIEFLSRRLSESFEIFLSDGNDAIEIAFENIPDIIICDLNLVNTNGFIISNALKKDLRTSHIPIIMLTADTTQESVLEGLKSGIDLYLTKPFSFSVLLQSINSMLYNREKLRFYYTNNIYKADHTELGISQQGFLSELNNLIDSNLANPEYGVSEISKDLSISRTQLYRKVKAILNCNISEYILNRRLDLAKELLKKHELNVSEVAYEVGFATPNYFSTSFKRKFGISPREYKSQFE